MKKLIAIILFLNCFIAISQNSRELLNELNTLRQAELSEQQSVEGVSANVRANRLASISAKYQKLESKLRLKYDELENQQQNQNELKQNQNELKKRNQQRGYNQQVLFEMQRKQTQSRKQYQQNINTTLNSLSSSLQSFAFNGVKKEITRRAKVAKNFAKLNSNRIEKVKNLYKQIPVSNFTRNINGRFKAHLFLQRRYSFINNQELTTEIPCIVVVKNNKITNLYPYGKKGFELDYPKNMETSSYFSNGIVKYNDFNTLETITVILVEPYLSDNPKQYKLKEEGTGFITLYTSKKKDENKEVWIQEIDKKGNIVREISTTLVYAKKKEVLTEMNIKPLSFNTKHTLYYFGEPVQTPYGTFPFFLKTSKSDTKPLSDNENRFVRIKKYRQ